MLGVLGILSDTIMSPCFERKQQTAESQEENAKTFHAQHFKLGSTAEAFTRYQTLLNIFIIMELVPSILFNLIPAGLVILAPKLGSI